MTHPHRLYEDIWATLPSPSFVLDPEDRIIEANSAAEGFMNHSLRALVGQYIWDLVLIDAPLDESLQRARQTQTPLFINDVAIGTGQRAPSACDMRYVPMLQNAGRALFIITPRNVSGRLGDNYATSKSAKSAIGMAEMLAHEIKNPLAGITGAAQLLSMNLSIQDRELTELIVGETKRILKLLEQVEQFGQIKPPERSEVNLHDILDRARRSALLGFGAHMRIIQEYDPSLPLAWADPDQLLQVALNLIKNAAEASKGAPGTIWLRTYFERSFRLREEDGTALDLPLQIEIADNGPGLPKDIRDSIFDPFVSGRENGTGLGLALVSKIISDHHSWVTVESAPGKTVLRLSLPRAPKHQKQLDLGG